MEKNCRDTDLDIVLDLTEVSDISYTKMLSRYRDRAKVQNNQFGGDWKEVRQDMMISKDKNRTSNS